MPSVLPIWSTNLRNVFDLAAASLMTATSLCEFPRTRASGAMRGGAASTAINSVALASNAHPMTARTTAPSDACRVDLAIVFPSPSRQEAENADENQKRPKTGVEFAHSGLSRRRHAAARSLGRRRRQSAGALDTDRPRRTASDRKPLHGTRTDRPQSAGHGTGQRGLHPSARRAARQLAEPRALP